MEAAANSIITFANSKGYLLDVRDGNIICVRKENLFARILKSIFGVPQEKPDLAAVVRRFVDLASTHDLAEAFIPTSDRRGLETLLKCGDRLQQLQEKNPDQIAELNDAIRALNDLIRTVDPLATQYQTREVPLPPPPPQIEEEDGDEEMGLPETTMGPAVKARLEAQERFKIGDVRYQSILDLHCLHEESYPNPYIFQKAFAIAARKPLDQLNLEQMSTHQIEEIEKEMESDRFIAYFGERLLVGLKKTREGSPGEEILDEALNALNRKVLNDKLKGLTREQRADFLGGQKPEEIIHKQSPKKILKNFSVCEGVWALKQKNLLEGVWRESGTTDSLEEFREKFIFVAHQVLHPRDKNRYTLDPKKISKADMKKILTEINQLD